MELYLVFKKKSNLYRKMPWALSDVWRHFTVANVEGRAVYICKYCVKSHVKNATKMQNHLAMCIKFPQRSQQATSDKRPFTCLLNRGTKSKKFWWMSCSSCVCNWFTSDAHRQCVLEEISDCSLPSKHPSNQTCFIYSFAGCRVQQSSSEGQANHRESRLYCNHLWWVVECSWARNN